MTRKRWILAPSLVAALAMASAAQAQTGEVVQATPSAVAVDALNRNLASLSRNPQDVTALLGAGQAALDLGDIQAANGFFTRANMVNPRLGKAKLGLAIVEIALKQPTEAAANFDAAEALGESAVGHLSDRGLAYDLTGQQAKAQRDYQAALRANPADEMARLRYAVSLGISGHIADADRQLEQSLSAGDREAWRMRAFILAMNGRIADARKVTQSVMPKGLADALDPYMQRLPLLSAEQKAAAAHYGEYPANVLKLAAPEPTREREVQVAEATTERESNRRDRRSRSSASDRRKAREAESRQQPTPTPATVASSRPASASPPPVRQEPSPPPPAQSRQQTASPPVQTAFTPASSPPARTPPTAVSQAQPQPQRQPAASSPPSGQGYEAPATVALAASSVQTPPRTLTQGPSDPQAAPPGVSPPAPAAATTTPQPGFSPAAQPTNRSLADALSALDIPDGERQRTAVSADLSAVARIQDQRRKASEAVAAKAKADAEAKARADAARKAEAERKAKLAANPSRNWVQIATGKDVDALAFDLRRLRRTYSDAIGDQAGWTAEWGATRRLLVGPFKKAEDAKAVVSKITRSGGDAFLWQSEAGEEVTKIGSS